MSSWGEQKVVGDQGVNKKTFHNSSYSQCPTCSSVNIQQMHDVVGCRYDGDAYGTDIYTCKDCGWETSYQFDDAASNYYYEMRPRSPPLIIPPCELTDTLISKYRKIAKMLHEQEVRDNMRLEGLSPADIDYFFNSLLRN
eukprot:gene11428-13957_t